MMFLKRLFNSLVARLIGIGLLFAIFGVAIGYVQITAYLRENLTHVVSVQQLALAEFVADNVNTELDERRLFLERMSQAVKPELFGAPQCLQSWLAESHALPSLASTDVLLLDLQGKVVADFPQQMGRVGMSFAASPEFTAAQKGHATIGNALLGPLSTAPTLSIAAPVKDQKGATVAVLLAREKLNKGNMLDRLVQGHIGATGGVLLISPVDKLFVSASDPRMIRKPTPATGVNLLHDRAMAGYRGTGTTINAKGVEEISAMVSVPATGWFVVTRLPTVESLAAIARAQTFLLKQSSFAIVVGIVLAGILFTRLLSPLYRAAQLADKMTRGEIPLSPLPVAREDEVGHLTASFNQLLSKLVSQQEELGHMALHDGLTGLPNRKLLADRMQQALARAKRHASQVAVLYMDLDGFKPINDTFGHDAGDDVLVEIARRLSALIRETDTLARVGGDEFVLLMVDLGTATEKPAQMLAEKCIAAVAQAVSVAGTDQRLGVSIGIAIANTESTPNTLLLAADKAMYDAKHQGRGRYVISRV